ncbi:hypothetical protein AZE42_12823 [Rhizopogon vesiculosus]|uniref:Uncharacterized protein n=1 Tax=Rhizopogon vesiculosus TaxID=180088 RepID=A0A1J8Q964_9AGAM|nr:hypothetical protein AZE42_12823 [Rhizopogon vesiculosus]
MFTLSGIDAEDYVSESPVVILHENRPVTMQEQLYGLLRYCHEEANYGGRDKTCAVIRQHYSCIPKDLTAQFVKAFPVCNFKRSNPGLVGQSKAKDPACKLQEKQVAESQGSLSQRGSLEESWLPGTM